MKLNLKPQTILCNGAMRRVSYPTIPSMWLTVEKPQAKNSGCPNLNCKYYWYPTDVSGWNVSVLPSLPASGTIGPLAQLAAVARQTDVVHEFQYLPRLQKKSGGSKILCWTIKAFLTECRNCNPVWNCLWVAFWTEAFPQMLWLFSLAAVGSSERGVWPNENNCLYLNVR